MTLGICTCNVGPALATLIAVADAPQGATTMCILAIFLGAILSGFAAAAILGSRANCERPQMHRAGRDIRQQCWIEMDCTPP
jgi:hypothetical protein